MADIQAVFAENVRKHRKAAGLSQEKLAELAGLHRTYIGGIEQRRVNPSLKNIGKVSSALGVDPALLLLSDDGAPLEISSAQEHSHDKMIKGSQSSPNRDGKTGGEAHVEYALVRWDDNATTLRPIDVAYEDLTIHVLSNLISEGHEGSGLVERYNSVYAKIVDFLSR